MTGNQVKNNSFKAMAAFTIKTYFWNLDIKKRHKELVWALWFIHLSLPLLLAYLYSPYLFGMYFPTGTLFHNIFPVFLPSPNGSLKEAGSKLIGEDIRWKGKPVLREQLSLPSSLRDGFQNEASVDKVLYWRTGCGNCKDSRYLFRSRKRERESNL